METATYSLVTPPASEPITAAQAMAHLRVIDSAQASYVAGLITVARQFVEQETCTGRQLMPATWQLAIDRWPHPRPRYGGGHAYAVDGPGYGGDGSGWDFGAHSRHGLRARGIRIRRCPLIAVNAITYLDPTGTLQTLDPSQYRVLAAEEPAVIVPTYGVTWPVAQNVPEAITVSFQAGYATSVPQPLVQYMLLLIGAMYYNRESEITNATVATLSFADRLLDGYRVFSDR